MQDTTPQTKTQEAELNEWLEYQRTQFRDLTDREILSRIVYMPGWRDHAPFRFDLVEKQIRDDDEGDSR